MAFLCAFIHSTSTDKCFLWPRTAPGPGNTAVYIPGRTPAFRGENGQWKYEANQYNFDRDELKYEVEEGKITGNE